MGVCYDSCERCGETYPDCGDWFPCDCCESCFCCDECGGCQGEYPHRTCVFCRGEAVKDTALWRYALERLGKAKEELAAELLANPPEWYAKRYLKAQKQGIHALDSGEGSK